MLSAQEVEGRNCLSVTPQDSVKSLLKQARWGDGSAYLKLADCYRDGYGVKKDFLGMITMANMAECRGVIDKIDDYIKGMPDSHEYKSFFYVMDGYMSHRQENVDSVKQALRESDSPEAKALLGLVTIYKGDSISGMNMIKEAADQGCSLAKMLQTATDGKGWHRADPGKLRIIADSVPFAYALLGDMYYRPDENGNTDKKLAIQYYMKAEEHGVLAKRGASRVLEYYKNGGEIQLTEDDVKRLELIVKSKTGGTE